MSIPEHQREADRIVGNLRDVQHMDLLIACRAINEAKRDFAAALERATTAREVRALSRLVDEWEKGFSYLADRAAHKLNELDRAD